MLPQLRRVILFTTVMIIAGGCSGPGQLDTEEQALPYDQFILGMPVAPVDGWDAFNRRMAKPEEARTSHGEVIMNITLDDAGRVTQVEPLFYRDERLLESTVAAVRDTEFLLVDSDVTLDELQFTLNVSYLRGDQYGASVGFFDIREELPSLSADEATTVMGRRYLYGYGPDSSEEVEETPPEIIGGLEGIQQMARFPRQERIIGIRRIRVFLSFTVNTDGRAENIRVIQSAGRAFDNEARAAVRRARFHPATRNGEPVPMEMVIPITWRTVLSRP